jgi:hypothetical protein
MNRRTLGAIAAAGVAFRALGLAQAWGQGTEPRKESTGPQPGRMQIGLLIHPDMILLDLAGPLTGSR